MGRETETSKLLLCTELWGHRTFDARMRPNRAISFKEKETCRRCFLVLLCSQNLARPSHSADVKTPEGASAELVATAGRRQVGPFCRPCEGRPGRIYPAAVRAEAAQLQLQKSWPVACIFMYICIHAHMYAHTHVGAYLQMYICTQCTHIAYL